MSLTPAGNYMATLAGMTYGETAKGAEVMTYTVDVQVSTTDVRRRTIASYFTGGARQYTEEQLRKMGFNGDFDQPAVDDCWYKEPFEVYCKHEERDDGKGQGPKVLEKWAFSQGNRIKPADANLKAQAAQRWRASNGAPAPKTPPASAPPAAVAPKGPPPPAAPTTFQHTKNSAWEEWANEYGDKIDVSMWNRAVQSVGQGRHENAFTSNDWGQVAAFATIPF